MARGGGVKARDLVVQTGKDLLTDNVMHWSAALAYYGLMSIFPLLLAVASVAAFFVPPDWAIERGSSLLAEYVPEASEFVADTVEGAVGLRGPVGVFAIAVLLWVGTNVFGALATAMNVVAVSREPPGLVRRLVVRLKLTAIFGTLFLVSLTAPFLVDIASRTTNGFGVDGGWVFAVVRYVVPALMLFATYTLVYRYIPSRRLSWNSASVGAFGATVIFFLAREGFLIYVRQLADFNMVYGPIAMVIVLLFWVWIMALITLSFGSLAAHYEDLVMEGKPLVQVEREHRRRGGGSGEAADEAEESTGRGSPEGKPREAREQAS
jgi:membrane protein